jgi:hypothetical protein
VIYTKIVKKVKSLTGKGGRAVAGDNARYVGDKAIFADSPWTEERNNIIC